MRARIHYGAGLVVLAPMPAGYVHADLCAGPCRGCGGTARREFPVPDSHRRRIPRLRPRDCHDCVATGLATVDRGSVIHRDLRTRQQLRADLPAGCDVLADACADALADARAPRRRYTVRTARDWARAHLSARTAPYHGLPQHGPATYTAWCALSSRLLRGYPWTLAGANALDPVNGCPHCHAPFVSHLGEGSRAGRWCHGCGQYEGFPAATDESRDLPVCGFCGAAGADDVLREEHYAPIPCCADEDACRARVNRQNVGLPAESRDLLGECPRCGQQSAGTFVICARCRAGDRADQGTQDRLFTPTAAPIPGQLNL